MGAQLGGYTFTDLQTPKVDEPRAQVETVSLIGEDGTGLDAAAHIATAVNLARTLVNEPANVCTPERFAELARDIAKAPGFESNSPGPGVTSSLKTPKRFERPPNDDERFSRFDC